jgi:hypothetical protein
MMKMTLAAATATAMIVAVPWFAGSVPAKAEGLQMAQSGVDVQIGRDRDEKARRDRRNESSDVSIGVGPKGIVVGPKERCKNVTTTVERDGRKETTRERRCD